MRKPGLVSVTFRKKTRAEICALCEKTGLKAIEWGGDVHVPPNGGRAVETRRMCSGCGIEICSYGSYFRLGQGLDDFSVWLEEAARLGAPVIRIWAGNHASADVDGKERGKLVDELILCAHRASEAGVRVSLEYHGNTLTDSRESVSKLLSETAREGNVFFHWQPRWDWTVEERLSSLADVRERLCHLHVFAWRHAQNGIERLPLLEGENMWKPILKADDEGCALIEFVRDDSEEALKEDAKALIGWLEDKKASC